MIFSTSLPRFKAFLGDFSCKASDLSCCLLLLSSFLLPTMRRSVAAAAGAVLSDARDDQGLPLVIHNLAEAREEDCLTTWKIVGHFRYPVERARKQAPRSEEHEDHEANSQG